MKKIFNEARRIVSYAVLNRKIKSNLSHPFKKISSFYQEINKMGIIPLPKVNMNSGTNPEAKFANKKVLMFASNDYLGLSNHHSVVKAAQDQLLKHGTGPGGSRFLCGDIELLDNLDKKIAEFVGTEDALTFPTGYMANVGIFQAIMDPLIGSLPFAKGSGVIFSDEYNHGSIVDGCRLSNAKKIVFRHNDMEDLKRKIAEYSSVTPKMIVTEGVFTPHGDISPLPELIKISQEFNCILMVDDAHGIGVLGKKGGGTTEHLNILGKVDILMGSFDKALGSMGGFLAGKKEIIEYLRISMHSYMLSSSVPAVLAGGVIESINICMNNNELREKLFKHTIYIREKLEKMGYKIIGGADVPVVIVYIGDEIKSIKFSEMIFERGVYCPSFRWPVVPQGESRVRITAMVSHTPEQIDKLVEVFEEVGKKMNII